MLCVIYSAASERGKARLEPCSISQISSSVQRLFIDAFLNLVDLKPWHHLEDSTKQTKRPETLVVMAFQSKPLTSSLRHPSIGGSLSYSGQSSFLATRINEKKVELENLKQLRDLSGDLATQMQALEQKLATLSDGTEGMFVMPVK